MNQSSLQDRRQHKRKNLAYYMLVVDAQTQEKVGHLVDITLGGFLMDSQKSIPPERDFRLRVDTMPDVSDKTFITFTARSKWCKPDSVEPHLFDVGFRIVGISQHDAEVIQKIIDKYASQGSNGWS
jgi:hypothetical protein